MQENQLNALPSKSQNIFVLPGTDGIPFNKWIGMKFVIRTLDEDDVGPSALLEVYRDLLDGQRGAFVRNDFVR